MESIELLSDTPNSNVIKDGQCKRMVSVAQNDESEDDMQIANTGLSIESSWLLVNKKDAIKRITMSTMILLVQLIWKEQFASFLKMIK